MDESRKPVQEGGIIYKEWTKQQIDDALRDNGLKVGLDAFGYDVQKLLGFEMELSPNVARGKFVVSEKFSDSNGQLIGGLASYITESIGSAAAAVASKTKRVAGVELNLNNLHPAYVGQEVTVIARPLKKSSSIQTWEVKFETDYAKKEQSSTTEPHGEHPRETVLVAIARLTLVEQSTPAEPTTKLQKMLLERDNFSSKL